MPFIPALASIVATVGYTAAAVVGAAGAISLGTAYAIGGVLLAAGTALTVKAFQMFDVEMPQADSDASRTYTTKGTVQPVKIVYGEALVSGPITYVGVAGDQNQDLYHCIALTGHISEEVKSIYFDDIEITTAQRNASGQVTSGRYAPVDDVSGVASTTVVTINTHDGTYGTGEQNASRDSLLGSAFSSDWTSNHLGQKITYMVTKFTLPDSEKAAELWDKYTPTNIKAIVKGVNTIYDPRDDTSVGANPGSSTYQGWSDNPALCLANYLTDSEFGVGIPASKIDWQSVADAANDCDATVNIPNSQTQKAFTCNGILFGTDSHKSSISKLLSAMNGNLIYSNGKYYIHAGAWIDASETLNENDLRGPVSIKTSVDRGARFNTIKPIYASPSDNYKMMELPPVTISGVRTRDNNEVLEKQVQLPLTNNSFMAQRIAHQLVNRSSDQRVLTFPANLKGLRIKVGDRVSVTISEFGYTAKTFQCIGWSFSDGDSGGVDLTLIEDTEGRYDPPAASFYSEKTNDGTINEGFPGVSPPKSLTATGAEKRITVAWTNPVPASSFSRIYVYGGNDSVFANHDKVWQVNTETITEELASGTQRYYWVRAVKTGDGATSGYSTLLGPVNATASTITADSVEWVDVDNRNIGIGQSGDSLTLSGVDTDSSTATGQGIAESGVNQGITTTSGGVTFNQGGSIKTTGKDSETDTTAGFFLGYNADTNVEAYTFAVGDSSNSMVWNGSALTITGTVNATGGTFSGTVQVDDYITVGGSSSTSTIAGISGVTSSDLRMWAGDTFANSETAPFRVESDGTVITSRLIVTQPNDTTSVIFDSAQDGLVGVGLSNLSQETGIVVQEPSAVLSSQTATQAVTLSSTQTLTLTVTMELPYPKVTNSTTHVATDYPSDITATIQYSTDSGSNWSTFGSAIVRQRALSNVSSDNTKFGVAIYALDGNAAGYIRNYHAIDAAGNLILSASASLNADDYLFRVQLSSTNGNDSRFNPDLTAARTLKFETDAAGFTVAANGTIIDAPGNTATIGYVSSNFAALESTNTFKMGSGEYHLFEDDSGNDVLNIQQSKTSAYQLLEVVHDDAIPGTNQADVIFKVRGGSSSNQDLFTINKAGSFTASGGTIGTLVVSGDLTVQGTTTTIDTANLNVEDKNITLNYGTGDTSANADGAGITIQDAVDASTDATLNWNATDDRWEFSHQIETPSLMVGAAVASFGGGATFAGPLEITGNASYVGNYGYGTLVLQDTSGYPGIYFREGNINWLQRKSGADDDMEFVYSSNASAAGTGSFTPRFTIHYNGGIDVHGGTITSGNVILGNQADIDMDANSNGQLEIRGNGYTGAIALNDEYMNIYHNSSARGIVLGVNEAARVTVRSDGDVEFYHSQSVFGATRWYVSQSDLAHQRVDVRDDNTEFARAHWYGVRDDGATSNFRHAWYDGNNYINVTASDNGILFQPDNTSPLSLKLKSTSGSSNPVWFRMEGKNSSSQDFYFEIANRGNHVTSSFTDKIDFTVYNNGSWYYSALRFDLYGGVETKQVIANGSAPYATGDRYFKFTNDTSSASGTLVTANSGNTWLNADGGKDLWLNWYSLTSSSSKADLQVGDGDGGSAIFTVDATNRRAGVNDTSPSYSLDVDGDIRGTGTVRADSGINVHSGKISTYSSSQTGGGNLEIYMQPDGNTNHTWRLIAGGTNTGYGTGVGGLGFYYQDSGGGNTDYNLILRENQTSRFFGRVDIDHSNLGAEPYSGLIITNTQTSGSDKFTGVTLDAQSQVHYRYKLNGALKWQTRVGAGNGTDDFRLYSWTTTSDILIAKPTGEGQFRFFKDNGTQWSDSGTNTGSLSISGYQGQDTNSNPTIAMSANNGGYSMLYLNRITADSAVSGANNRYFDFYRGGTSKVRQIMTSGDAFGFFMNAGGTFNIWNSDATQTFEVSNGGTVTVPNGVLEVSGGDALLKRSVYIGQSGGYLQFYDSNGQGTTTSRGAQYYHSGSGEFRFYGERISDNAALSIAPLQRYTGGAYKNVFDEGTGVPFSSIGTGSLGGLTRDNYDLQFKPNSGDFAGLTFTKQDGNTAGHLLVRANTDLTPTYKADGITLVGDGGWLSLVQRTTNNTGIRLVTGSTPVERLTISSAGVIDAPSATWNRTYHQEDPALNGFNRDVHTHWGVLCAGSKDASPSTYTVIETNIDQDSYRMGGFTILIMDNYGSDASNSGAKARTRARIDLAGYWNPEVNGGFMGWNYTTTNPRERPTIQIMRNSTTGKVAFAYQHSPVTGASYPIIVACDLWIGYSGANEADGKNWSIFQKANLNEYTNSDQVNYVGGNGNYQDHEGRFTISKASGTMFSHGSYSDAIGYNPSYGTYVGAGSRYVYSGTTSSGNGGSHPYYSMGDGGVFNITHDGGQIANTYNGDHTFTNTTGSAGIKVSNNQSGGPAIKIHSTNTNGTDWWLISNSSSNTDGAGKLQLWSNNNAFTAATFGETSTDITSIYTPTRVNAVANSPTFATHTSGNTAPVLVANVNAQAAHGLVVNQTNSGYWSQIISTQRYGLWVDSHEADNGTYLFRASYAGVQVFAVRGDGLMYAQKQSFFGAAGSYAGQITQYATSSAGPNTDRYAPNGSYVHHDPRNQGNHAMLHKYTYSGSYGYGNYRENWWDGNSYHELGSISDAIRTNGDFVASGNITAYGTYSDIRLKENVRPFENARELIKDIGVHRFNYIGKDDDLIGVIAQEVEQTLPQLVYELIDTDSDEVRKAVRYDHLSAVLLKVVKEQEEEISELKAMMQKILEKIND